MTAAAPGLRLPPSDLEHNLNRDKNRPRQSSGDESSAFEPYEELAPFLRTLIPVGTSPQAPHGSGPSAIFTAIADPILTTDGTELDFITMDRPKDERDQLHVSLPPIRPLSLRKSPSTVDSSTIYSGSDESSSYRRSTTSISETSVSSGMGSPSVSSFDNYYSQRKYANEETTRPTPRAKTRSERASMSTGSIISDSPPLRRNSPHTGNTPYLNRPTTRDGVFYFPRPDNDEEIEAWYRETKRSLDIGDNITLNITVDQKWQLVYNAELQRWSEERKREKQTKKQTETVQSTPLAEGSPEWYIQKFMDQTITPGRVSSLEVSLRTHQLRSILSQHSPPSVAEKFLAGLSTSFQYKVLLSLHKPLYKYRERATRGD